MDKKGIVIIPSWYPGPEDPVAGIFVQQQAKALLNTGFKISIFFVAESRMPGRSVYTYAEEDRLPTYRLKAFVPPKRIRALRGFWYSKWERLLHQYLDQHGVYPRLLHAHSFVGGAVARYLGKKYAIPYVITEHYDGFISGKIPAHWQPDLKDIYQHAAGVIAVSASLAEAMFAYCPQVKVIPNMIDTELFRPAVGATLPATPKRIISVGSLVPRKNFAVLLRVFAQIKQEMPLELVIVGDGPLLRDLQRLAGSLGIEQAVHFTGTLSPGQVAAQLQSAHLYVSTSKSESFALAPVEALACGVPVVAMRCGGILEDLEPVNVRIVDAEKHLEEAITQQLTAVEQPDKNLSYSFIREQFSPEVIGKAIIQWYQLIL